MHSNSFILQNKSCIVNINIISTVILNHAMAHFDFKIQAPSLCPERY